MVSAVTDDPGVMGNLPRSRPGRRSAKRAAEVKPPKRAGAKKPSATKATARTTSKARPAAAKAKPRTQGTGAARKGRPAAKPRAARPAAREERAPRTAVTDERVEERQGQDPLTAALRAGMAVGDAGVKVLAKIVQRLPRP